MSKKIILIIIGIAVLIILGASVYSWKINEVNLDLDSSVSPSSSPSSAPATTSEPLIAPTPAFNSDISDWKTYRNEEYGFKFKYPQNWISRGETEFDLSRLEDNNFYKWTGTELEVLFGKKDLQGSAFALHVMNKTIEEAAIFDHSSFGDKTGKIAIIGGVKGEILDGAFYGMQYVVKDGKTYFFEQINAENEQDMKDYDDVIKTFKFIENDTVFSCGASTVKDIDGNLYKTVKIGSQCWMKENIKVTKNPEGKAITRYCYNNDLSICKIDGGLYDWNTAMDSSNIDGAQGICPNSWHIPKDSEWYVLESGLATDSCDANRSGWGCNSAGMNLKQNGSSGFEGIFAGYRAVYPGEDGFYDREKGAYFWSSTKSMPTERGDNAIGRYLNSQSMVARSIYDLYLPDSFSIRCLKD